MHDAVINVTRPGDSDFQSYLVTWEVNGMLVVVDDEVPKHLTNSSQDIKYSGSGGSSLMDGDSVRALVKSKDSSGNVSTGVWTTMKAVPNTPPGDPTINSFTVS